MNPLFAFSAMALASLLAGCATPPLISAAEKGDDVQVQALLNSGVDVNENSAWKGRALFRAASRGRASTVKLLLDRGADPDVGVFHILCAAVMSDSVPTVKVLLDHGIPINEPNCMAPYSWTPLDMATGWEKPAVAAYLRAHGGVSSRGAGSPAGAVAAGGSVSGGTGAAGSAGARGGSMFGGGAAPEASEPAEAPAPPPQVKTQPLPKPEPDAASDVDEPSYKSRAERPDDFALLIGISKYRDIPEAQFADRDAKAMKRHLLAMGYPEENIISLIGDHATNTSIAEKLERWLPMNVNANSTVFVYYSGHGAPDAESKQAYLVPWDGQPGALADTAYPLSRFYKDLQKLPAKRVLVALDSCFSGAGGRSVLAKGARPLVTKLETSVPQDSKLVVFTASQADQISGTLEDQGHGAFTYYFLKGLNGEASAGDSAGHVTVGSLYLYLAKRVNAAAHRQEREQNPQLSPPVETDGAIRIR
jgi:hypothetical protein